MAYGTEFRVPDEIDPEEAFDRLAGIRSAVQRAVVEGEFEEAVRIGAEGVEWAGRLVGTAGDPDVVLPVKAQIVALAADAVVASTVAADVPAAVEGLRLVSQAAQSLLVDLDLLPAGFIPCPHNRPSYTGKCRKRPPCPLPGT